MLIALALQTSIRLFGFWADSSSDIHRRCILLLFQSVTELHGCMIASPGRYRGPFGPPGTALQSWGSSCSTALVAPTLVNPIYFGRKVPCCSPHAYGLNLLNVNAHKPDEFEAVFETSVREGAGGMVLGGDSLFFCPACKQLVALAARYHLR